MVEGDVIQVDRGDSPWQGYTSSYQEEEAGKHIAAVVMQAGFERLPGLVEYVDGGEPLLAVDRAARRVVVNARCFSALERCDAAGLAAGARHAVGVCTSAALRAEPRRLARFLVLSQLVQTYWHIGATVHVAGEVVEAGWHRVRFAGSHEYYTNSHNTGALAFRIELELATGVMVVVGE